MVKHGRGGLLPSRIMRCFSGHCEPLSLALNWRSSNASMRKSCSASSQSLNLGWASPSTCSVSSLDGFSTLVV
jgi:hypothetical protein